MYHRTVGEIMTHDVARARPGTPYQDLVTLLRLRRVSGVPVVDHDDKVVGVVSEADLLRLRTGGSPAVLRERRPGLPPLLPAHRRPRAVRARLAVTAAALMSTPAITIHPGQRASDAARVMDRRHVNRLPVVDEEDRLIGIVTRHDLLRVFVRSDEAIHAEITEVALPAVRTAPPGAVTVSVRDGLVTLGGVADADGVAAMVRSAWRVDGVTGVINRLTVGGGRGSN
ncbi:CBS domain-containing protein [Streptomyces sp. CA-181903]|uniref:CBS domain-containing protein n=1 Tax=Streptomyces sp. CA-181903 TaxID=3240055 RepID=UPI003D8E1960